MRDEDRMEKYVREENFDLDDQEVDDVEDYIDIEEDRGDYIGKEVGVNFTGDFPEVENMKVSPYWEVEELERTSRRKGPPPREKSTAYDAYIESNNENVVRRIKPTPEEYAEDLIDT